jgi:hypothetical protein
MSDHIYYNYGANYAQLDGIKASLNDAETLRGDVQTVFNALGEIYMGEAATALQAAHVQISQLMDQLILDMQAVHAQAVERQATTAQLDHQLAGGF